LFNNHVRETWDVDDRHRWFGRVAFSRRIPGRLHQRLRNVLLNQWV